MEDFLKKFLGGDNKPAQAPAVDDAGFADFAEVPDPSPASITGTSPASRASFKTAPTLTPQVPFTKWYRIWERTQLSDFYSEMIILPFIVFVVFIHILGVRRNKRKVNEWAHHHLPPLQVEFAQVGFKRPPKTIEPQDTILDAKTAGTIVDPGEFLREQAKNEYVTYATGRNNIAFVDLKVTLQKWYNPLVIFGEYFLGLFFDSLPPTIERMEVTSYAFDNKEAQIVPRLKGDTEPPKTSNSSYDGFVFAIVHKNMLQRVREDRYDLSLTTTKDHPKLPEWTTVLSEHGEITDTLLTQELIKAIDDAGDLFDALVISDQPIEKPSKLNDTTPRKRISLSLRLPSNAKNYIATIPLFTYFLRLPDKLVSNARFRPEVMRRIRATRDDEIRRLTKAAEDEKAIERKTKSDKEKKEKRDALLKNMSSDEQKKFLEKEKDKEMRKSQKRRTMRA